jgi:hypothetical protein
VVAVDDPSRHARNLSSRFVQTSGYGVRGELDPYTDPECGCRLQTRFSGTLQGDSIAGTYTTRHIDTRRIDNGEWHVVRRMN